MEALSESYALTINCVTHDALVDIQRRLVRRFPKAVHFCDTPIFKRWIDLPRIIGMAKANKLFSLEDWPTMPNIKPMLDLCARSPNSYQLRFEHIGIATHFLSVARTAAIVAGQSQRRILRREKDDLTCRCFGTDAICVHREPTDAARSKISAWNGDQLIEDFFEIRETDIPGVVCEDVIYRRVEGDKLRYFLGNRCFREVEIPRTILALFLDRGTRFAIHELDKCISLMDVLRAALEGKTNAYGYLESVKDAVASRLVNKRSQVRALPDLIQQLPTRVISAFREGRILSGAYRRLGPVRKLYWRRRR
jgi:hypothetical protein